MRRTQSVRNHAKSISSATGSDELSVLKESDDGLEDVLRRQLLEKDKENDKVRNNVPYKCAHFLTSRSSYRARFCS
jgi:hypothetical protein